MAGSGIVLCRNPTFLVCWKHTFSDDETITKIELSTPHKPQQILDNISFFVCEAFQCRPVGVRSKFSFVHAHCPRLCARVLRACVNHVRVQVQLSANFRTDGLSSPDAAAIARAATPDSPRAPMTYRLYFVAAGESISVSGMGGSPISLATGSYIVDGIFAWPGFHCLETNVEHL